jgi:hypothetical protein
LNASLQQQEGDDAIKSILVVFSAKLILRQLFYRTQSSEPHILILVSLRHSSLEPQQAVFFNNCTFANHLKTQQGHWCHKAEKAELGKPDNQRDNRKTMTVSTSSLEDGFHTNHTVVMMSRDGGGDFTGNRQSIAAILSTPMCIGDKEDVNMRLVSPRVVSPLECSMEHSKATAAASALRGRRSSCRRLVGFSDEVSVFLIPRRSDYPKDLRDQLFSNKREISRNAARNMKEYASEGFDWRKVKEGKNAEKFVGCYMI